MAAYNELPMAFLIFGGSKVYNIESNVTKIGRAYENDLVVEYPQVSRQHAELRYLEGNFEIVDLDSTGGTFVNGVRVKRQVLNKGDVISLVNLHFVFGQDELPDPEKTTQYRKPQDARGEEQDTMILPPDTS
jgi:pSer/pThr/pTyr-binding forkhead associated (FHA) protein